MENQGLLIAWYALNRIAREKRGAVPLCNDKDTWEVTISKDDIKKRCHGCTEKLIRINLDDMVRNPNMNVRQDAMTATIIVYNGIANKAPTVVLF